MAISDLIEGLSSRNNRYWKPPSWRNIFITLPWVIGLIFSICGFVSDRAIAGRERMTHGIIRTHEPANHDRFGYEFSVNEKRYNGWQIPSREFEIGQQVLVYYDPHDPTTNSLDSFAEAADRNLGPALCCAFGIAVAAAIIFATRRSRVRRQEDLST